MSQPDCQKLTTSLMIHSVIGARSSTLLCKFLSNRHQILAGELDFARYSSPAAQYQLAMSQETRFRDAAVLNVPAIRYGEAISLNLSLIPKKLKPKCLGLESAARTKTPTAKRWMSPHRKSVLSSL
jgi:hypothetical protein